MNGNERINNAMPQMPAMTLDAQLDIANQHVDELVTDHRHFTARWLTMMREKANLGMNEWMLAKIIVNLFCVWLTISERAGFGANAILVGVPLLLFFSYPEENASGEDMLVYWPCFALISLFDFVLEAIPFYYTLKLLLFAMFFLQPFHLASKIRMLLQLRQLYHAASSVKQSMDEALYSSRDMMSSALPPAQVLSQLLTAASRSGNQMLPPQLPPQVLAGLNTTTARAAPSAQEPAQQQAASEEDAVQQSTAGVPASSSQQAPTEMKQSFYQDLRPSSKTKLTGDQQSMYVANPKRSVQQEAPASAYMKKK